MSDLQFFDHLVDHLLAVKPTLRAEDVTADSSLTEDLGFDSLDLARLAGRIRDDRPDFDLRTWLANAMRTQVDSVGSMAAMLAAAVPHA
jgi:acyl carrier protein